MIKIWSRLNNAKYDLFINNGSHKENIYQEDKIDSYVEAFNKSKYFIDKCMKGILINNEKIYSSLKPKISVVIPCYNCKNYLLKAVRSVQTQNFRDFEIVIVNDNSSDETFLFIEELQKEDYQFRSNRRRIREFCIS